MRRLAAALVSILVGLLLAEGFLRVLVAVRGEAPPHHDRSLEHEWRWARRHLDAGKAVLPGFAVHDPELGWVMRPDVAREGVHTNSVGMRSLREFAERPAPGRRRIVFVGDSYTFGSNVDDEATLQAQLERDYVPGWDVLNMGVPGYGPDQSILLYEKIGRRYHADVVVLGFLDRGFDRAFRSFRYYAKPRFVLDETGRLRLEGVPVISPEDLYELYATGQRRIGGALHSYLGGALLNRLDRSLRARSPDRDSESWRLMAQLLRRFRDRVNADGSVPFLLIFPNRPGRCGDCSYAQIDALAEQEARALGMPVLSLRASFLEHTDDLLFNPDEKGGHLSPRGHALAARLIHAALLANERTSPGVPVLRPPRPPEDRR